MADATHAQGVYFTDGGNRLVVASNGKIDVEEGGEFDLNVSALSLGSQANVIGSAEALSSTITGVLKSFADDGGASVASSTRNIQGRTLLTVDQAAGTIRSVQGQLKMLTGVDVTTGIYTAVQGYVEMAGTHVSQTGATFSCFDASMEIVTSLTVDSGGEACGLHIETTGAGTITNNGTCAGILISNAASAADWPVGVMVVGADVLVGMQIGAQANVIASGVTLASGRTGALKVYTDDAGASVATSSRGILSRTLLTVDQAGGTIRSLQGQLKMNTGVDVTTGIYTALQGYVEMAGTHVAQTGATFSCVDASMEIVTSLTVDSGGEACGIHVETTGAGSITNNGTCSAILVDKASGAADWPVGLTLLNCTKLFSGTIALAGATALNAFEITTTSTQTHSTGYQRSLYISHTHGTGNATGSSEINALSVDVQATSNVTTLYAFTGYTGSMAAATINRVAGYAHYLDAITGTVAASSCAHLETNGGASYNSIISVRRHAGTIHSVISDMSGGATATNLFEFNAASGPATVVGGGTYSTADGYFTVKVAGSTYRMPFYTGTD